MIKLNQLTAEMAAENAEVEVVALITKIETRPMKTGKDFLQLELTSKEGVIGAKKWTITEADKKLKAGCVIEAKANVNQYQGTISLVISELNVVDIDASEFTLTAIEPVNELTKEFNSYVEMIKDEQMKAIIKDLLSQEDVKDEFFLHPAAKANHGNEVHGLLSHVTLMLRLAVGICDSFNKYDTIVNTDLVITGIIFHDIGKLQEMDRSETTGAGEYTKASLLGHIYLGAERIHDYEKAGMIDGYKAFLLKHIVLSHHGALEYGSPVLPEFIEAKIVSKVDGLEADIMSMKNEYLRLQKDELAANTNFALQTHVYKPLDI